MLLGRVECLVESSYELIELISCETRARSAWLHVEIVECSRLEFLYSPSLDMH
jgi:hypothetical protein